jgi:hypothetical protein
MPKLMTEAEADEFQRLPVMEAWAAATKDAIDELGAEWVITFMRNLADGIEANMKPVKHDS